LDSFFSQGGSAKNGRQALSSAVRAASIRWDSWSVVGRAVLRSVLRQQPLHRHLEFPVLLGPLGIREVEIGEHATISSHDGGEHLLATSEQDTYRIGGAATEVNLRKNLCGPQIRERRRHGLSAT